MKLQVEIVNNNKTSEPILKISASLKTELCAFYCDINILKWQTVSVWLILEGKVIYCVTRQKANTSQVFLNIMLMSTGLRLTARAETAVTAMLLPKYM